MKDNKKIVLFVSLLLICILALSNNTLAWDKGSEAGGGSDHGNCNGHCGLMSSSAYPYGYRMYIMNSEGQVLDKTNVVNPQGYDNFKFFSGNKIRKDVVNVGNAGLTPAEYTSTTLFKGFMDSTKVADFNEVFVKQLGLIDDGKGSYCTSKDGHKCLDLDNADNLTYMLNKLQKFLDQMGFDYNAKNLYDSWNTTNGKDTIYLAAEAIGSLKTSDGKMVSGTCTELIYYAWKQKYDGKTCSGGNSTCQNMVLLELCNTGTLTAYDGAGYYKTKKIVLPNWASYDSGIFDQIISGNIKDGNVEGRSIFLWKISDFFGNVSKCPTNISDNEKCSLENYKRAGCCSCEKAAALEASGIEIPTEVKNKYANYPTCSAVKPSVCSYKLEKNVPDVCSSNTENGYVKDNSSWECAFSSTNSKNDSSVRNNYSFQAFSNKYCAVYCKEEIEFSLPSKGAYTDAGTYLTVSADSGYQTIGPIKYTGTSTCRTTSVNGLADGKININKFKQDFDSVNKEVLEAYDNWQYAELQNEVINSAVSNSWTSNCTGSNSCSKTNNGVYYTYSNRNYVGATFTKSTNIANGSCSCSQNCGHSCTSKVGLKDTARLKQKYIDSVNKRINVLEELKKCNNFYRTYNDFKPSVTISYEDELYKKKYDLKGLGAAKSFTNYYANGNATENASLDAKTKINEVTNDSTDASTYFADSTAVSGNSSSIAYYDCGANVTKAGCSNVSYYQYPTNSWYEQTTTRTYTYSLPDDINQYINKPSGESTDTPNGDNYTHIAFSNLPVHYSTTPGEYIYSITTNSFGVNNKFNQYIMSDKKFNNVSYRQNNVFSCKYKVSCDKTIICGKNSCDKSCFKQHGTNLMYRKISLYYPFPGQDATVDNLRKAGANWQVYYGNDVVSDYIYNNRDVSYYEVYGLSPMYEITLTPQLMRKIKKYNSIQNNKEERYYVGTDKEVIKSAGYSDFTLECKNGADNGKNTKCTSQIIRDWGVTGCAIFGSNSSNCGNTVAW